MWNQLKEVPSVLAGQSILTFLDLESIVRLETSLSSNEQIRILRSFLSYLTKFNIEIQIPQDMSKLKWLQAHDFPIKRAIVHLDMINANFETNMIQEIELMDNTHTITNDALEYLPNSCFLKVVSIYFDKTQDSGLMEELFSRFHNLRELNVRCRPDGWILSVLQGLYLRHNILVEKIIIIWFEETYQSIVEMVKCCPKLRTLYASFSITEDSLLALSTHCPLLKELNITCIPQISTEQTAALCAPALFCIHSISTPSHILHTDIPNYTITISYLTELRELRAFYFPDHVFLPLISQYCLKLESIEIGYSTSATPVQLLQLAQNCPLLKSVHLMKRIFSSDDFVIQLIQCCPNLQKLNFDYHKGINNDITDSSLIALSQHCLQLKELNFQGCRNITEGAVLQLIHSCKHLYKLTLFPTCLSNDTVLNLPVTVSKSSNRYYTTYHNTGAMILTFNHD